MPKKKYDQAKRINIYLPPASLEIWDQIENGSKFVQIALQDAAGIMAWNLMGKADPIYTSPEKLEDVIEPFNEKHPLNELSLKQKKWKPKPNSDYPKKPELW